MMAITLGSTAISKAYLGSTAVSGVYIGSNLVWSSFVLKGMDKLGSQTTGSGVSRITGWTPRAESTVVDEALQVTGTGTANIFASIGFTQITDHNVRIYLNGVQIAQGTTVDRGVLTASISNVALSSNDRIEVYGYTATSSRGGISASNTYLTVTPVS